MPSSRRTALLCLILATAFWGISFPLVKALLLEQARLVPEGGSWFFSAWSIGARFALAALVLLPCVRWDRFTRSEVRQGLLLAAWAGPGMWLQADGLAYTAASTSAFLTQGYCVLLPLWAAARARRPPPARTVIATLMVLLGVGWLAGVRPGDLRIGRGEIETLLAALLFTFQILALEKPVYAANDGVRVSLVMFAAIALLFAPVAAAAAPRPGALCRVFASGPAVALTCAIALCCTAAPYLLMNSWQKRVAATEAGLIYCFEPVFTALCVLFLPGLLTAWTGNAYPNETWGLPLLCGGGLITAANLWMHAGGREPRGPH